MPPLEGPGTAFALDFDLRAVVHLGRPVYKPLRRYLAVFVLGGCVPLKAADDRADGGLPLARCAHRQPPPPPTRVTAGPDGPDLVFAFFEAQVGAHYDDAGSPLYPRIGFDLDDTCTGEGQGSSCAAPSWPTVRPSDGVDGIDNAFGKFSLDQASTDPVFAGDGPNYLLRVRGYSGEPNDDQVEVSWYCSPGPTPREDGGVGLRWDGRDRWTIDREVLALTDGEAPSVQYPRFVDPHAYVSDGVLVSRFDEVRWNYSSFAPTLLIPVRRVVLQGSLKRVDASTWELDDGVVGWRVAVSSLLFASAWNSASGPFYLDPYCSLPNAQPTQIVNTCKYADIAYDDDSPKAPCDALSVGIWFQAMPALLGEVGDPAPAPPFSLCDRSVHPGKQSCDSPKDY